MTGEEVGETDCLTTCEKLKSLTPFGSVLVEGARAIEAPEQPRAKGPMERLTHG